MVDARSDECHPKCVSLPSVLFSATTLLVSLRLELDGFSGLLFMSFSRLVMPFLLLPFFEIS